MAVPPYAIKPHQQTRTRVARTRKATSWITPETTKGQTDSSIISMPGISKSVQRYQLAVDEAKVRLDFVVAPGTWLMPSRMVINTESVVGYNNKLKQTGAGMMM